MKVRKITATDVCEVTGYSRHQLRGLLDDLLIYSRKKTVPRVAREFTRADLIVLAVVRALETRHSVRRDVIASISDLLRRTLAGPKMVNRDARLLISFDPPTIGYLTSVTPPSDGILMSLRPIFQRVDQYLGHGLPYGEEVQPELKFGPGLVAGSRKKAVQ
ncbi:MAG: hypothetical protein Q7J84_16250 [Sulfuricaulis sp.]|nr:hypothetical protein [Sulfuricaulis sp.]